MLFGFSIKKGKLYDEFNKLDPKKIIKRLDLKRLDPKQIIFITYQMALYGGLDIQNTLREKKIIKYADQDMIFIEGVAFTWANINSMVFSKMQSGIEYHKTLLQGFDLGGGVLAEMLSKHSGLSVSDDFYKPYQAGSAVDFLSERLLSIPQRKDNDPLKDQIAVPMIAQICSASIQKGILDSVESMIQMYLKENPKSNLKTHSPPKQSLTMSGIGSQQLFTLCINNAQKLRIQVAEFQSPRPKLEGLLNDMFNDMEKNLISLCLLHSYALTTYCMFKADRKYLGSKFDSEFGSSIMSNLIKFDMDNVGLPGDPKKDKSEVISWQKKQMKEALEFAISMVASTGKAQGLAVFEAVIRSFCSKTNNTNPKHIQAIERLSKNIIVEIEEFNGKKTISLVKQEEPSEEFKQVWRAAGQHIQNQADSGFNWIRANLNKPMAEHLSFRIGNQIFFVFVEAAEFKYKNSRNLFDMVCKESNAIPCLLPMSKSLGKWQPQHQGWGFINAESNKLINPLDFVTDELIEMTDWEIHDTAIQFVCGKLNSQGKEILSNQSSLKIDPSIWFQDETGIHYIIVRGARHPKAEICSPSNIDDIKRSCSEQSCSGYFASVIFANKEDPFDPDAKYSGNFLPLYRGYAMLPKYSGLLRLE